jgi:hypothetical protein
MWHCALHSPNSCDLICFLGNIHGRFGGKAASPVGAEAAAKKLGAALRELIEQLRNGTGIDRPTALPLLEVAQAAVQRSLRDWNENSGFRGDSQ